MDQFIRDTKDIINPDIIQGYFELKPAHRKFDRIIERKQKLYNQLKSQKKFELKLGDKVVPVIVIKNDSIFYEFLQYFYLDTHYYSNLSPSKNKHTYLSIDFEFDAARRQYDEISDRGRVDSARRQYDEISDRGRVDRTNVLTQMHFQHKYVNFIFVINPNALSKQTNDYLVKNILCNNGVTKIMHGSESMDIPYMYSKMFSNNNDFINFMSGLYDTLFACQYVTAYEQYLKNEDIKTKCGLYNALLKYEVIDKKEFDYLEKLSDSMGPIHKLNWGINALSNNQLRYATYDVLYLRSLYRAIVKRAKNNDKIYEGILVVPDIFRLICMERAKVANIISKLEYNDDATKLNIHLTSFTLVQFFKKACMKLFNAPKVDFKELERLKLNKLIDLLKSSGE